LQKKKKILFSDAQAKKVGYPINCENCKRADKTKAKCYGIEPNPSKHGSMQEGDNPSF
jgi:hypothetical protein